MAGCNLRIMNDVEVKEE